MTVPAVVCRQRDVDLGVAVEVWLREPELKVWRAAAKADGKALGAWIAAKTADFVRSVDAYSVPLSAQLTATASGIIPSRSQRDRNWVNHLTSAGGRGPVAQVIEDLIYWARTVQLRVKAADGFVFAPHPLCSSKDEQLWWGHTPPPDQMVNVRLSGTQLVHFSRVATVTAFPDLARWMLAAVRAQRMLESRPAWERVALFEAQRFEAWGAVFPDAVQELNALLALPQTEWERWTRAIQHTLMLTCSVLAIRGSEAVAR